MTETDPALLSALLGLVEPTRRGDPESALCWTTLSTRKLAQELTVAGHRVGPDTVARLLHEQGFSLQGNAKTIEDGQHVDRDAQFSYLNTTAAEHLTAGDPVSGTHRGRTADLPIFNPFINKNRKRVSTCSNAMCPRLWIKLPNSF